MQPQNYGLDIQTDVAKLSERVLWLVRKAHSTEIEDLLNEMISIINTNKIETKEKYGFWERIFSGFSLFENSDKDLEAEVEFMLFKLEAAKALLTRDIAGLEETYELALRANEKLDQLIEAGPLFNIADERLHDLRLTKAMAMQTLSQIRHIQLSNKEISYKIESAIQEMIPSYHEVGRSFSVIIDELVEIYKNGLQNLKDTEKELFELERRFRANLAAPF